MKYSEIRCVVEFAKQPFEQRLGGWRRRLPYWQHALSSLLPI